MDFSTPLVLPVDLRTAERRDPVDLYFPDEPGRSPAVLLVHGGPIPAELRPTPRDWGVFRGYGSLLASRGVVAATVDHRLHSPAAYPAAADDVRAAVETVRADPRVDQDRVALWFFSGGGPLAADWLREPPPWLRAVALTYPLLAGLPGWPVGDRFRVAGALAGAGDLPIVLTRVGLEAEAIASIVSEFVASAEKARLEIIDVPRGHHSFDVLDDDDDSRAAIERAVTAVLRTLA